MLEVRKLSFRYERKDPWIVRDFGIDIAPGEVVGLPGPSGRGKSTLARIMAGYLEPCSGSVKVDGLPLPGEGFCPVQLIFQHPELAVNPRWKIRTVLKEAGELPSRILQDLAIEDSLLERYPHELSGGELQRVCLARALHSKIRYLLCDEMTSMLDALNQAHIWKAVLGIAMDRRIGLLVISHDVPLLNRLCHRTVSF